jgi:alkanesulfonate monooxygenase SsuD/methylene tetrahydromethanopterin reductase-like flavin-dependent oxidoreductase (luciferase family)
MKFGLFYELSVPRPWTRESERTVYMNALEQVKLADELGFDYVWAVEHHFLEEYSHCPSPELFLTACAMVTKRIRVGHGIVVCVPEFNHPIKIAERTATLDILSGGRLDVGTGRSATWTELGGFNADPDLTKQTWDEFVRCLPKMWTSEKYSYQGRFWSMPPRTILPKVYQRPHPPLWVAVTSPGTELDAADRGLGSLGLTFGMFAEQEKKIAEYRRRIQHCNRRHRELPLLSRGRESRVRHGTPHGRHVQLPGDPAHLGARGVPDAFLSVAGASAAAPTTGDGAGCECPGRRRPLLR